MGKYVLYDEDGVIGYITLNRPDKMNALSLEVLEELKDVIHRVSSERRVKVVVLKGAGKCFSTGHDLKELLESPEKVERVFNTCMDVMNGIRSAPQAYIACVHGYALAAGCQLVAACDLAVASEDALFGLPGIRLGLFCFTPTAVVSRCIGVKRAFELAFTGEYITAKQALEWGLVNRVVPRENLDSETKSLAEKIARFELSVIERGKRFFYKQLDMNFNNALEYATKSIVLYAGYKEAVEGIKKFFEERRK